MKCAGLRAKLCHDYMVWKIMQYWSFSILNVTRVYVYRHVSSDECYWARERRQGEMCIGDKDRAEAKKDIIILDSCSNDAC